MGRVAGTGLVTLTVDGDVEVNVAEGFSTSERARGRRVIGILTTWCWRWKRIGGQRTSVGG